MPLRTPRSLLIRGHLLIGAGIGVIAVALALESLGIRGLFAVPAAGIAYLAVVSVLMLVGAAVLVAVWIRHGSTSQRVATLPAIVLVALYHLILINGPG